MMYFLYFAVFCIFVLPVIAFCIPEKEDEVVRSFPYDRPAGYVTWPKDGDFKFADSIVAADKHLQMSVDHPDNW